MEGPGKYLEVQHTRQHQDQDQAYGPHKPQDEGQGHRLLLRVGLTMLCQGGVTMKVPPPLRGTQAPELESFPDSAQLLGWCAHYRLEGIANKNELALHARAGKAQRLAGTQNKALRERPVRGPQDLFAGADPSGRSALARRGVSIPFAGPVCAATFC